MAEAYYEPTPATDGATMNPVPGAVFQVFEIADTTFSTPLSLRVGSGNPTTSVTASDTLATLPGVYVTSPNYEHIWKSGNFEWRRDSIDGAKKAIEDAKLAAENVVTRANSGEFKGAKGDQGAPGLNGSNVLPTSEAIEQALTTDGPAKAALSATIAEAAQSALAARTRVSDAILGWWVYPLASYTEKPSPRTVTGGIAKNGDVIVGEFEHLTGKTKRNKVGVAGVDDHNPCAVSLHPGKRPLVFWQNHNADAFLRYRVGVADGDMSQWLPEQSKSTPAGVSYSQVFREGADPSAFWVFYRAGFSGDYNWYGNRGVVNESTGVVTWGTARQLLDGDADQLYMIFAPTKVEGGASRLRFAAYGHPLNGTDHKVYYGEVDLDTGDMTVPGSTAALANIQANTGLPLNRTQLNVVMTPAAGKTTRLFAVRGDEQGYGATPAVACMTWNTADGSASTYHHYRLTGTTSPGLKLTSGGISLASTPDSANLSSATLSTRWVGSMDDWTPSTQQTLARKFDTSTGAQRSWTLSVAPDGRIIWQKSTDGTATLNYTSSVAPTVTNGAVIGVGVDWDGSTVTFKVSYNSGATWENLGDSQATSGGMFDSTAPVQVGVNAGTSSPAATVKRYTQYVTIGGAVAADIDFTSGWANGATSGATKTDPQGNVWTLGGTATISALEWLRRDFGDPGDPFGYTPESKYVAGMTYPVAPRGGEVLYLGRNNGGVGVIEKHYAADGTTWTAETLVESSLSVLRPTAPAGGGPVEVVYSEARHYGDIYTDYDADTRYV